MLDLSYLKVLFYGCSINKREGAGFPVFGSVATESEAVGGCFGPLQRDK